jgi:hypothetical protein
VQGFGGGYPSPSPQQPMPMGQPSNYPTGGFYDVWGPMFGMGLGSFFGGLGGFGGGFGGMGYAEGGAVDDEQRETTPMGFYSAAAEAATKIPQKAPIDQILNKLRGSPNVKAEELDWSGVRDAFAGQKSVDPQEVARHLQTNLPQIKETVYGGKPPVSHEAESDEDEEGREYYRIGPSYNGDFHSIYEDARRQGQTTYELYEPTGRHMGDYNSMEEAEEAANRSISNMPETRYDEYKIPGGSNYREVVMHLPENKPTMKYRVNFPNGRSVTVDSEERARGVANVFEGSTIEGRPQTSDLDYKSSHWEEMNPVAHLRLADRDNGKTLHVEELQSDWGQAAQQARKKEIKRIAKEQGIKKEEAAKAVPQDFAFSSGKLPVGPHVTDTKGWVDLGIKRALMEAARGGYDRVVFTPGEEQANRYSLSKHIKGVSYDPEEKTLSIMHHNSNRGYRDIPGDIEPEDLEEHIGKEAAEKLLATDPHPLSGNHILEGQDLEVGGEGMKKFYDSLLPNQIRNLVGKYDKEAKLSLFGHEINTGKHTGFVSGEKVMEELSETKHMRPDDKADWWRSLTQDKRDQLISDFRKGRDYKVHSLEITPKLRAAILKGLPAFEHGGSVIKDALGVVSKYSR